MRWVDSGPLKEKTDLLVKHLSQKRLLVMCLLSVMSALVVMATLMSILMAIPPAATMMPWLLAVLTIDRLGVAWLSHWCWILPLNW